MLIAVMGGTSGIERIKRVATEEDLFCQIQYFSFKNYHDMAAEITKSQSQYDALLFTGNAPYTFSLKHAQPTIPWFVLPHSRQAMMGTLLKASAKFRYDITRVSIDAYELSLVHSVYKEIGFSPEDVSIAVAEYRITSPEYLQYLINFHKNNYRNGQAKVCLTGYDLVVKELQQCDIPCLHIDPQDEIIVQTFHKIRLEHLLRETDNQEIVSIIVKVRLFDYQICGSTMLENFRIISRAKEYLYLFAQNISAIVLEISPQRYLLLSSKQLLVQHTKNMQNFSQFAAITTCDNVDNVYVGIGLGSSFQNSLRNAEVCFEMSEAYGKSCFYLMEESLPPSGPFPFLSAKTLSDNDKQVNDRLLKISAQTNIGISMLKRLENVVNENHLEITTSAQLGELLHISSRSVNRIIQKLEDIGCIREYGKAIRTGPGRPHRLLKIDLNAKI